MGTASNNRELRELENILAQAILRKDSALSAQKKLRQIRGAAAHKRGWYWQEQVVKAQIQIASITEQIESLRIHNTP
jgi:hypothetical protein